jgi:hypothetical protein
VIYTKSGKYDTAGVSSTKAGQTHGPASCTQKSSFEAVIEVSDKGVRREVTLEEDMDITVEPNLGAGSSSISTDTFAAADGIFDDTKGKYLEDDQAVHVEKLEFRGSVTGSNLPKPVRDTMDSADDEVREITRQHSSSPSPAKQHQSQGRKLSRSPPRDKQDCCSTSSSKQGANKSSRKSSNSTSGNKDRHHSLLAERRIPGFASDYTRELVEPASRLKERRFSPERRSPERRFKSQFHRRSPERRSSGSRSPSPSRRPPAHTSKSRRDQEGRSSSSRSHHHYRD